MAWGWSGYAVWYAGALLVVAGGCAGTKPAAGSAEVTPAVPGAVGTPDAGVVEDAVTLPDDLCTAVLGPKQMLYLIKEKVDDDAALVAIEACHRAFVSHTPPVVRDVLHIGVQMQTPFFGFGLEPAARQDCLGPGSPVRAYLDAVGVCNEHLQTAIVLFCFRQVSRGEACSIPQWAADIRLNDWRLGWKDMERDAIPDQYVRNRHGQGVEREYATVLPVLDYLADQNDYDGAIRFDPQQSKPYDGDRVVRFLWPAQVTFTDVNGKPDVALTPAEIRRELGARRGRSFEALSHLGSLYGMGYLQYSLLWLERLSEDRVVVYVGWRFDGLASHYRLTYGRFDGEWKLGRVDYRDLHGQVPPWVLEHWEAHGYPPGMKPDAATP